MGLTPVLLLLLPGDPLVLRGPHGVLHLLVLDGVGRVHVRLGVGHVERDLVGRLLLRAVEGGNSIKKVSA